MRTRGPRACGSGVAGEAPDEKAHHPWSGGCATCGRVVRDASECAARGRVVRDASELVRARN